MKILVVGGAGYVGSHAAHNLCRAHHPIWVYDNLSQGHRAAVPAGCLIEGDLLDTEKLTRVLRDHGIEAVMHFAAYAQVGESVADPARYYKNNVVGTLSLLEAMRAAEVRRIVFSSTTATYGVPEKLPITEENPQHPINPYGFTKLVIERALADYARAYGIGYAALRYFNAAGASTDVEIGEVHSPETRLIPLALQVALGQREEIVVFGDDYDTPDGTCIRDYVHVDDLAAAHLKALERITLGTGLELNLGTGRGYSVREVLDACRRITGHRIPERLGSRRAGDPPVLVADISRARRELQWEPQYRDLDSIVATAWHWHARHPHGFRDPDTSRGHAS